MQLSAATRVAGSRIREIAVLADRHPGTLRLFFGEDTRPTPDFIKRAGQQAIAQNQTFYTPNAGNPSLREAIAEHVEGLHGARFDPETEVVVTASGMIAIQLTCQATVGPGRSAVVVTPLWPNIAAAVRVAGAEAIEVPLAWDRVEGFRLDLEAIRAAIRPDTRLLALASPGNPTGWTATREDWRDLVALCVEHDLWLLADKVYERIAFDEPVAPSPFEWPGARERTIVVQSFSKAYRMTGWRIGYTLAKPEISQALTRLQEFAVSHAAGFTQAAAETALRDGEAFVAESLDRYRRHRSIAVEKLSALDGLDVPEPPGAFYLFPRIAGLNDSYALCQELVRGHGVGLAPGAAFGAGGEGHLRICFAVDEPTLIDALDRFAGAWRNR